MQEAQHKPCALKEEGLDIGARGVIVDCVHFRGQRMRRLLAEGKVVLILVTGVNRRLLARLVLVVKGLRFTTSLSEKLSTPKSLKTPFQCSCTGIWKRARFHGRESS